MNQFTHRKPAAFRRIDFVLELLFPAIARAGGPAPCGDRDWTCSPIGPSHVVPLPAGSIAVTVDPKTRNETRDPISECYYQLFEHASPDGQRRYYTAEQTLVGADGPIAGYPYVQLADRSREYCRVLIGTDRDELLQRAQRGYPPREEEDLYDDETEGALDREEDHG